MPVPNLSGAIKGWTEKITVSIITKSIVDYEGSESTNDVILDINIQPMPPQQVDRKPEGERYWKWFSIIVKDSAYYFKNDDILSIDGIRYKIMKGNDWRRSGFTKYEAIQDYEVST
jgi:hypothetical protein